MKSRLRTILAHTNEALSAIDATFGNAGPTAHYNDWMLLMALTPPILAAFTLTEVGKWAMAELKRQVRIHEKRPASSSLRGTPTPEELSADWNEHPRALATCLRIGSRLADLDPTLDRTFVRRTLPSGKTVIKARKGGMKGWLSDHRVHVTYSTVMRYKKLAQRLRQVLSLDDRIPLEWLLSGIPSAQTLPSDLQVPFATARRRLAKLLRDNPTFKSITLAVEKALGIVRLVTVHKSSMRKRFSHATHMESHAFSIISQGQAITVLPERVDATKKAMGRILQAKNLSGNALHLQNRLKKWLSVLTLHARP